jgi:hypothetical protein
VQQEQHLSHQPGSFSGYFYFESITESLGPGFLLLKVSSTASRYLEEYSLVQRRGDLALDKDYLRLSYRKTGSF